MQTRAVQRSCSSSVGLNDQPLWPPHRCTIINAHSRRLQPERGQSVRRCPAACASLPQACQELLSQALQPAPGLGPALAVNSTVFILGIRVLLAGLMPAAVALSWGLGTAVFAAFGPGGYLLVCLYFIFGSAVTKVKLEQKQREGIAEARSGRRSTVGRHSLKPVPYTELDLAMLHKGSVWGSGLAGIICAALALVHRDAHDILQVAFVASFVSKLSDTVSSEIGKAYGKTTFLITDLSKVPRGTEGAVSLEGTAAGVAAAFAFSAVAIGLGQVDVRGACITTAAAVVANLFESYLGAASQGRLEWLSNDAVNAIQICLAACIAVLLLRV